jgi:hypothetical protein
MKMSNINKLLVITFFGLAMIAFGFAANAQVSPILAVPPVAAPGLMIPFGNAGNGITSSYSTTTGTGNAAATDSFTNNFLGQSAIQGYGGPFGLGLWNPCACGLGGTGFASTGPFQTGLGANLGTQSTSVTGSSGASSFGLQPTAVAFGVPVAGPNGCLLN